ncbi:syntaxin of plants 81 [Artemisia annua]|uniref:Syntaxin of plants 81 n=1 Tax=Artemisia annua TaxID=35608 RepID=A0A2U1M1K8_ARTAN|nr:syntaxin of plants 81 [Artemisia annua]
MDYIRRLMIFEGGINRRNRNASNLRKRRIQKGAKDDAEAYEIARIRKWRSEGKGCLGVMKKIALLRGFWDAETALFKGSLHQLFQKKTVETKRNGLGSREPTSSETRDHGEILAEPMKVPQQLLDDETHALEVNMSHVSQGSRDCSNQKLQELKNQLEGFMYA